MTAALATDRPSAAWSMRWWLIRPASAAATVSAITTTGSRSSAACAIPLTALASPGPRVTTTAPGTAVRSALVAAMIVAAVSPCARTKRSPAASAAPTTSRLGPPPGTPNISRVPARASAATIAPAAPAAGEAVLASTEAPLLTVVILWVRVRTPSRHIPARSAHIRPLGAPALAPAMIAIFSLREPRIVRDLKTGRIGVSP